MKRIFILLFLALNIFGLNSKINAQERRPIDSRHPMWMIHIDVWNNADPQKIIDLIPKDIKPYVCLNLSMSCAYDTSLKIYKKPQDAIQTYRSWASVCCRNNMWFTCQPASGGHTHIPDNSANFNKALEIHESFFIDYKNFLGWNYAEQFWGFNEQNDASSSKDTDRIKLFAKLVPMHHKYGGFLTISFCGNIWSHPLNPIGMMKRNSSFLNACKANPEAILFLYKYTTSANWFNNESVTIGPFISGLAKNYGVRYDNCGWNGAIDELCKNDGKSHTYPGAVGIAPVLEQMTLNGACVWDGPELIWTEDFKGISNTTVNGYTRRNWGTYPNFDNIWVDMFRKVLDGTIHIATREEVIERTKMVIRNDISETNDATGLKVNAFAAPLDLYHGLYLQDDPFNAREAYEGAVGKTLKGYGNNNFLYFKKTGRYQTIPVVINLYDSLAKTIPTTGVITRTQYNTLNKWKTEKTKVAAFDAVYPEVSKGDLFVARHHNELTCYYPFSYLNKKTTASADVPLLYNSCDSIKLKFGRFDNALIHEYADHINFYFNNYRADSTTVRTDIVTIVGAKEKPTYTMKKRTTAATGSFTEKWEEETGTYTLTFKHNGPYDVTINCTGNGTDLLTDYVDVTPIAEIPAQPEDYYGDLIIEAEDMDFKSISANVTNQYDDGWGAYRAVRGHSGMGFQRMGTNTAGALRNDTKINFSGKYLVTIKYSNLSSSEFNIRSSFASSGSQTLKLETCATNEWKTISYEASVPSSGKKVFLLSNISGKDFYVDNVTFSPIELDILTDIDDVTTERVSFAKEYYSLSGAKLSAPKHGINIIRMADGSVRKVFIK